MIEGKKIYLRAIEEEDLPVLLEWRNNKNLKKYFREYRELNMVNQKAWFNNSVIKGNKTLMFGIVDKKDKSLIGACGLCYIDWIHRHAELSIYIGKDDIYIDTNKDGYAWDAMDLLFDYGFNQLNIHKIWVETYCIDEKKKTFFNEYGFHTDGCLRDNYFYNGKYHNSIVFSMLSNEWNK